MSAAADVSAVVCTWNAIASIEATLRALRENGVKEVIVVDADSDDGTREVAERLADMVVTDPRKGLATARNYGIAAATGRYVLNCGADNVMPPGSIETMIAEMKRRGWTGVSACTVLDSGGGNYLSRAMDAYKRARYYPGTRAVIGTPTIFATELLQNNPYDPAMSWSDDGDLCTRLGAEGHTFGISHAEVLESGTESLASVFTRWRGYGRSDWETYRKYGPQWSVRRKIWSLLHPLRHELIYPVIAIKGRTRIAVTPFLFLITVLRYWSWAQHVLRARRRARRSVRGA